MVGLAHCRTCSMFRILFLDQCYPMETEALKFSIALYKDFPYRSSKFRLSNLMSSQKASNIENIYIGAFSRSINCSDVSLPFFVTPTDLVLITGKKSMVLFMLSEIINLKNKKKTRRNRKFPSLMSFTLH